MYRLSSSIKSTIVALDRQSPITTTLDLYRLVVFICQTFVDFLTVHPYLDGNGHAARTILCSILLHYGFQPVWTIDPRPSDSVYNQLIASYRGGNTEPLERYVMQWIT